MLGSVSLSKRTDKLKRSRGYEPVTLISALHCDCSVVLIRHCDDIFKHFISFLRQREKQISIECICACGRIRGKLAEEEPDPTMAAALPPGVWWAAHSLPGRAEPYGPHAGDAAVDAARRGDLQLRDVDFSYPLRPEAPGEISFFCVDDISRINGLGRALCIGQAEPQSQRIVSPSISAALRCHVVQCHAARFLLSLEGCCGIISCPDSAILSKGQCGWSSHPQLDRAVHTLHFIEDRPINCITSDGSSESGAHGWLRVRAHCVCMECVSS